jgi:branched-chain amino acid transport system substrate-binding protein
MKTKTLIWMIAVIIIILIIIWIILINQNKAKTEIIKIGAILPLTGDGAVDGLNVKRGMELAKSDLENSGIKVDINYQDDKTNPKESIAAVEFLAANYKPDVLIGPIWSFLVDSSIPAIEKNNLIAYSPATTSEIINVNSSNVFHGTIKNIEKAQPVEKFLKENKKKAVAIIISQDAWGNSHELAYKNAAQVADAEVVLLEKIPFGLEDSGLSTILLKVKESGADTLLWTGYNDGALKIIQKTQELGINITIIGTEGFIWVVDKGLVEPEKDQKIYSLRTKMSSEFIKKFKDAYNDEPGTYSDTAYDGLMLLAKSIQESKKKGFSLKEYLRDNLTYEGYAGHYEFDENNDRKNGGEWILERVI